MTIEKTKEKFATNASSPYGAINRHAKFGDAFIDEPVPRIGPFHVPAPRRSNLNVIVGERNLGVITPKQ